MKIWRYLTLEKFELMLKYESLFFTRSDQFQKLDRFEGSYPKRDVVRIDRIYHNPTMFKKWRKYVAVSCWHKNEYESDGMWQLYANRKKGIAIQSTTDLLEECCSSHAFVTEVKYIDYEKNVFPNQLLMTPFEHKRIYFKHEDEVRAIIWSLPPSKHVKNGFPEPGTPNSKSDIPKPGINIEVDLNKLIQSIVVSPESKGVHYKKIESLLRKYRFESLPLRKSDLSGDPVW